MVRSVRVFEHRQGPPVRSRGVLVTAGEVIQGTQGVQVPGDIGVTGAQPLGPQRRAPFGQRDPPGGVAPRVRQPAQVVQQPGLHQRIGVVQAVQRRCGPPVGGLGRVEVRRVLAHHPQRVRRRHHRHRRLPERRRRPVQHRAQPRRGRVEVPRQPLQPRQPLLRLAPQQQDVAVPAPRNGVAEDSDRRGDGDRGVAEAAQALLDLRDRDEQGGRVRPAAQPRRLKCGQPAGGEGQRRRGVSPVQRGQRLVPQAQRLLGGAVAGRRVAVHGCQWGCGPRPDRGHAGRWSTLVGHGNHHLTSHFPGQARPAAATTRDWLRTSTRIRAGDWLWTTTRPTAREWLPITARVTAREWLATRHRVTAREWLPTRDRATAREWLRVMDRATAREWLPTRDRATAREWLRVRVRVTAREWLVLRPRVTAWRWS